MNYEAIELSLEELKNHMQRWPEFRPNHFFNSVGFIENLVKNKKNPKILGFFMKNKLIGYIYFGQNSSALESPYSSTLGGFETLKKSPSLEVIEKIVSGLIEWISKSEITTIEISLTYWIYTLNNSTHSYFLNSLFRYNFQLSRVELTSVINLSNWNLLATNRNFRRNLNTAVENELEFRVVSSEIEKQRAYDVIRRNRKEKDFPLHLTYDYIKQISEIGKVDFCIVVDKETIDVASAIIYTMNPNVVMVVYWGDLLEYRHLSSMPFLVTNIIKYYQQAEIKFLDIGTSTKDSTPNYGLTKFKSELGGEAVQKLTLKWTNK